MSTLRKIHFNNVSPDARKRFCDALKGGPGPRVLLHSKIPLGSAILGWTVLSIIGVVGLLALWKMDFGGYAYLQSPPWLVGYGVGFLSVLWGLFGLVRRFAIKGALPYAPGKYLFPGSMIDARSAILTVAPITSLVSLRGVHHHTNGVYSTTAIHLTFAGGSSHVFNLRGKAAAEQLLAEIESYQRVLLDPMSAGDPAIAVSMDPLWGETGEETVGALDERPPATMADGLVAKSVPAVFARPGMVALIAAALLSYPTWLVRNDMSDDEAFERAEMYDTFYGYQEYLWVEGKHSDEVRDELMPRAQFREASADGSVTQLRQFLIDYPDHEYSEDAREAVHELFEGVYEDFLRQSTAGPETTAFVEALLEWLEHNDTPEVFVRFQPPSTDLLETVDLLLQAEETNVAPVAPHFGTGVNAARETTIVERLQTGFSQVFPNDVLRLAKGGMPGAGADEPTIDVSYIVGPSGMVYELERSTRVFAGIFVTFDVTMRVPGHSPDLSFNLDVEPPENFMVYDYAYDSYGGYYDEYMYDEPSVSDTSVYRTMADRAFDQLAIRINQAFFGTSAPAIPTYFE